MVNSAESDRFDRSQESMVGVFVDIENLTSLDGEVLKWILQEVAQYGPVVVRRAYGCWSNQTLHCFQMPLTRLGFEMIHAWHPVSGKDSADILMVVDVMHFVMRMTALRTVVQLTSDSDFSPLFRRLREMGRSVVRVGRRSVLSDMVRHTCSRFLYIGEEGKPRRVAERDDPFEAVLRILRSQETGRFDLGGLKARLLHLDPGFDERALGFPDFRAFLRAIPEIRVHMVGDVWFASLKEESEDTSARSGSPSFSPYYCARPSALVYQGLLRKKHWRLAPPDALRAVIEKLREMPPAPATELRHKLSELLSEEHSATDVRKAWNNVLRAFLLERVGDTQGGVRLYRWRDGVDAETALDAIDRATLLKRDQAREEHEVDWAADAAAELLYGPASEDRFARLRGKSVRFAADDDKADVEGQDETD